VIRIILLAGARPNFMKIAPLIRAIDKHNVPSRNHIEAILVHTGQHYDHEMSQVFFQDLKLPRPDVYLGVGSGTHAEQTGKIMIELEKVLLKERPDLVIVVGDVNSTLAGALATAKLGILVAHVEAGLRSGDRSMPEEINRLLTDAISDYLFTPSSDADDNLKKEGIPAEKIFLVGNIMVDSLLHNRKAIEKSQILSRLKLTPKTYALLTMHRPNNVDSRESLLSRGKAIKRISLRIPVVFPIHPRTKKNIEKFKLQSFFESKHILLTEPLSYFDFLKLTANARLVMTDSGGIQEETTVLNVPCLTLRDSTERPITISQGTNTLVGNETSRIIEEATKILDNKGKKGRIPPFWDGRTAQRIVNIICQRPATGVSTFLQDGKNTKGQEASDENMLRC
jgi:UDP-N-acetylglucosamine 2-epimerase (non-hydrolysing)